MNTNQDRREIPMPTPTPELLAKYEDISKGLSKDLVELMKAEQIHRHKLQKQYLTHFRLGQIFSSMFLIYIMWMIFELAKNGNFIIAYSMLMVFGLVIVLILFQYKKDKLSSVLRNSAKNARNTNYKNSNYQRNNNQ